MENYKAKEQVQDQFTKVEQTCTVGKTEINISKSTKSELPIGKCPIYCETNQDGKGYVTNIDLETCAGNRMPADIHSEKLCELTGTKNKELADDIILEAAFNICGFSNFGSKKNIILQSLSEQQPKDAHEARLCAQAAVLYSQGMDYLERATKVLSSDSFAKREWNATFMKTATKLLELHTKTVAELSRYKQNGEQRIVVQHVQVNDGGQAIVGGFVKGGGGKNKNNEVIPC